MRDEYENLEMKKLEWKIIVFEIEFGHRKIWNGQIPDHEDFRTSWHRLEITLLICYGCWTKYILATP